MRRWAKRSQSSAQRDPVRDPWPNWRACKAEVWCWALLGWGVGAKGERWEFLERVPFRSPRKTLTSLTL